MEAKESYTSPLKKVFENAHSENNIDLVLPVFLKTNLFVIGKRIPQDAEPDFFLSKSVNSDRFCVTVSESSDNFERIKNNIDLMQMTGEALLKIINPAFEIIIVYKDGGDTLTREHLEWFRKTIFKPE